MKSSFQTWNIHITGLVQGIGFRPFVYNKAFEYGLKGWVKNDADGLHVEVSGTEEIAQLFCDELLSHPPPLARITNSRILKKPFIDYEAFEILHDSNAEYANLALTPDYATCDNCTSDLLDSKNRRYQYPFITCCDCGPRYSIIHHLPIDRENTKMDAFEICDQCEREYNDPSNRRFYAQSISCSSCGIGLELYNAQKSVVSSDFQAVINLVSKFWREGKIVAIKGIGGYLITCSAMDSDAISTLRQKKRRPDKPLALMIPHIETLDRYELSEFERDAFADGVSPIVLVKKSDSHHIVKGVCDGLSRVGIMVPYAPIFQLLLQEYKSPIVATSGNLSNAPIVFQDEKALEELSEIADYILVNNREIVIPQDDSVVTFSNYFKKRIVIRRSRGLAPSYFNAGLEFSQKTTLSMGAYLKSTLAIQQNENIYISQYLGDLDHYDTGENYQHTLDHLMQLLEVRPELVVVDLHSSYISTIKGIQLAQDLGIPVLKIQHHIAHFSALLGEHGLIDSDEKVLGVIWDGTGIGSDDHIWGGEFFTYGTYRFDRCTHLTYYHHLANDKMAREPRLAALALCHDLDIASRILKPKFSEAEWKVYNQLLSKKDGRQTSSIGRLFDGVASLLGILDVQSYEGQAASYLQDAAETHFEELGIDYEQSYFKTDTTGRLSVEDLMTDIIDDISKEVDLSMIAAKYHLTLVHWIKEVAIEEKVSKIGFSGGVFQNTLLVDLIIFHLNDRFDLMFHEDLSPNDENISFGQLIYAEIQARSS